MADDIDLAQERIDVEMQVRLRVLPTFEIAPLIESQECSEEIPSKRRASDGVKRCFDCQNNFEERR